MEELYGEPLASEIDQAACRTADYATWQDNQALHFFDGEPLPLSADGYHYLRLARDLHARLPDALPAATTQALIAPS